MEETNETNKDPNISLLQRKLKECIPQDKEGE